MAASEATQTLDELTDALESILAAKRASGRGDAIDAVLNGPARVTRVKSLRDAPEVESFREALVDGLIRVDTANQLLRLVHELIVRLV